MNCVGCDVGAARSIRSRGPGILAEWDRSAARHMDFAKGFASVRLSPELTCEPVGTNHAEDVGISNASDEPIVENLHTVAKFADPDSIDGK